MDKSDLYAAMAERKFKPEDMTYVPGNNGRVARCAALIRQGVLPNRGILLDVGGGIGDLGAAVKDLFDKRIVIDISAKNLEAAEAKGNDVRVADVDKDGLSIYDDHVGLVAALDFIEHIVDPENFARECYRVLRPGGQVFINTPNIEYWEHLDLLTTKGIFPHTSGDRDVYHGGHLAFFTRFDLEVIFGSCGFNAFKYYHDDENYRQPPDHWVQMRSPKNQHEYKTVCEQLGNPNILFSCVKP